MLDLHCHLLPGVDDGPIDVEAAVPMALALVRAGFAAVAASPHHGEGPGGDVRPPAATAAREALAAALVTRGVPLQLLPSAEHTISPLLMTRLESGDVVPIGGRGEWLLVEVPWGGLPDPEDWIFRLQRRGARLLLAHPERHDYLELALLERLVARGVRLQIELGSFANAYDPGAVARARAIVERGLAHVLATDAHRTQDAETYVPAGLLEVRRRYGEQAVRVALHDNPWAIVRGATVDDIAAFVEAS